MNVSLSKVQTTIRLPSELKKELEEQARECGYTLKDFIIFILNDYLLNIVQE